MPETIKVQYSGKVHEYEGPMSAKKLLEIMGLNRESVLVVRNGELVTEDEILKPEDEILIINVISGG